MPAKIRKFGTLFLNDQPYIVDPNGLMDMPSGSISIQDTVRGMSTTSWCQKAHSCALPFIRHC